MSEEFVGEVLLEINGETIDDFTQVDEDDEELHARVKKMTGTGYRGVTAEFGLKITYLVPLNKPEYNFSELKGGQLTIDHLDGRRIKWFGVTILTRGGIKYDKDGDKVREITVMATRRED